MLHDLHLDPRHVEFLFTVARTQQLNSVDPCILESRLFESSKPPPKSVMKQVPDVMFAKHVQVLGKTVPHFLSPKPGVATM